jgi:translation elongation factor EF-G
VKIRVYPGAPGSGFAFDSLVAGSAIPNEFIPAVELGLREAASSGWPPGCPIEDVRIELYDGSYHDVDSSETAFKIAANLAFQDAVKNAGPVGDMFDDDASPVMQPRHPTPAPRNSAISLPEPDDAVDDNGNSSR